MFKVRPYRIIEYHIVRLYGKANRDTAVLVGHPLAMRIAELHMEMIHKHGIPKNKFKETLIFTLLENNPKNTHSRKRGVAEYDNEMLLVRSHSSELREELEYVCKLIHLLVVRNTTVDSSKIVEHTLSLKWNDADFNANNFLYNLQFDKFEIEGKMSKQTIVDEIKRMSAHKKEIHMIFA